MGSSGSKTSTKGTCYYGATCTGTSETKDSLSACQTAGGNSFKKDSDGTCSEIAQIDCWSGDNCTGSVLKELYVSDASYQNQQCRAFGGRSYDHKTKGGCTTVTPDLYKTNWACYNDTGCLGLEIYGSSGPLSTSAACKAIGGKSWYTPQAPGNPGYCYGNLRLDGDVQAVEEDLDMDAAVAEAEADAELEIAAEVYGGVEAADGELIMIVQ